LKRPEEENIIIIAGPKEKTLKPRLRGSQLYAQNH
jgi:hypothetical protein